MARVSENSIIAENRLIYLAISAIKLLLKITVCAISINSIKISKYAAIVDSTVAKIAPNDSTCYSQFCNLMM